MISASATKAKAVTITSNLLQIKGTIEKESIPIQNIWNITRK